MKLGLICDDRGRQSKLHRHYDERHLLFTIKTDDFQQENNEHISVCFRRCRKTFTEKNITTPLWAADKLGEYPVSIIHPKSSVKRQNCSLKKPPSTSGKKHPSDTTTSERPWIFTRRSSSRYVEPPAWHLSRQVERPGCDRWLTTDPVDPDATDDCPSSPEPERVLT